MYIRMPFHVFGSMYPSDHACTQYTENRVYYIDDNVVYIDVRVNILKLAAE